MDGWREGRRLIGDVARRASELAARPQITLPMPTPDPTTTTPAFRPRGLETTRLDTFVDAAFAFGGTVLLTSSGDLPDDIAALRALLLDIPSFALSFATMMIFWLSHRHWSRLYGLESKATIALTLLLVLTLLVYIYPLKVMYGALLDWCSGGAIPNALQLRSLADVTFVMGVYGVGFSLLSASMLGLYVASLRAAAALGLDAYERSYTRVSVGLWVVLLTVGVASGACALLLPLRYGIWAGMLYGLLAPGIPLAVRLASRRGAAQASTDVEVAAEIGAGG